MTNTADEFVSPDMIWRECPECERSYTLADATESGDCPRCH